MVTQAEQNIERELGSLAFHSGAASYLRGYLKLLHPDLTDELLERLGLEDVVDDLAALTASLIAHAADTSNPHSVTKVQVGLENADNTSDADKPISTATQTALDLKLSIASTTAAALGAVANAVNTTGKVLVAWRYDENGRLYRPLGALAADKWRPLDDQSGFSDITPS